MAHLKEKLLALMSFTYTQEKAFYASLNTKEKNAKGSPEKWSVKDTLAHIAAWHIILADNLAAVQHGETPQRGENYDRTNQEIFAAHQDDTWDQVLANLEGGVLALSEQVEQLSETQLLSCDIFPWLNGRPVWRNIAGNGSVHPFIHLTSYLAQHGRNKEAVALFESGAPAMKALSSDETWQGVIEYNLACVLALAGETAKAIAALHLALQAAPSLIEYSKEDSDLDSLRSQAAFEALYAS